MVITNCTEAAFSDVAIYSADGGTLLTDEGAVGSGGVVTDTGTRSGPVLVKVSGASGLAASSPFLPAYVRPSAVISIQGTPDSFHVEQPFAGSLAEYGLCWLLLFGGVWLGMVVFSPLEM